MTLIKDMANMNTRPSLVQFMSLKTDEVLRKFVTEIGTIENTFLVKPYFYHHLPSLNAFSPFKFSAIL